METNQIPTANTWQPLGHVIRTTSALVCNGEGQMRTPPIPAIQSKTKTKRPINKDIHSPIICSTNITLTTSESKHKYRPFSIRQGGSGGGLCVGYDWPCLLNISYHHHQHSPTTSTKINHTKLPLCHPPREHNWKHGIGVPVAQQIIQNYNCVILQGKNIEIMGSEAQLHWEELQLVPRSIQ